MQMKKRNFLGLFVLWYGVGNYWHVENWWINIYWERTLGAASIYIGLMVGVSAIAGVLSQILFGAISDTSTSKYGRRRPFILIGSITGGISMCFFPITRFITPLIYAVIYGVTIDCILSFLGDLTTPTRVAFLAESTIVEERGKINAYLGLAGGVAIASVVMSSGYIFEVFGPDYSFYSGGISLIVSGIITFFLIEDPPIDESEIDKNWKELVKETFTLESYRENKSFYILMIFIFFYITGSNVHGNYLFIYLETVLGLHTFSLAIVLAGLGILGFILGIPIGILLDKYGRKKVLIISVFVATAGNILFAFVPPFHDLTMLLTFILGGIGVGFNAAVFGASETWLQDLAPEGREGSLLGFKILAFVLPMTPGALLGGWLFDYGPMPDGFAHSPIIFIVGAIISLIGLPVIKYVEETLKRSTDETEENKIEAD